MKDHAPLGEIDIHRSHFFLDVATLPTNPFAADSLARQVGAGT